MNPTCVPRIYCKAFEDNTGALELAQTTKLRSRMKHINSKYDHFQHYVAKKKIEVHQVKMTDQLTGVMTKKRLSADLFGNFTCLTMGLTRNWDMKNLSAA